MQLHNKELEKRVDHSRKGVIFMRAYMSDLPYHNVLPLCSREFIHIIVSIMETLTLYIQKKTYVLEFVGQTL